MEYQALYRKYRPKTFDEVYGQEHITKTLANQVASGKISHAYLFTGTRGTGKTSTAKIFARAINCTSSINGSPCYVCETCKSLASPSNLDISEIDAASNNRVDEVREIRENVKFLPVSGKYKVYIIDEVHMLTDSAFNALLKTLEEPPKHAVFILATTEVHKLPATILSRCMRFDFKLVPVETLVKLLKKVFASEGIDCEEEAFKAIAVAGQGSVRDTLSVADCISAYSNGKITLNSVMEILGLNDYKAVANLIDKMHEKDLGACFEIVNKVSESGKNMSVFAKDISVHFRDLLVIKTSNNANDILCLPQDVFAEYKQQADKIDSKWLIDNMKNFSSIEAELRYSLSPKILVETAIIKSLEGEGSKKN
ncbi:MAG: DNA polymerase III subunit gamma/tau [Oscillospiraceae bacterium]|nr:DNA polymerase III subunit gamma/tau [Oscillospiraceae bacterium]